MYFRQSDEDTNGEMVVIDNYTWWVQDGFLFQENSEESNSQNNDVYLYNISGNTLTLSDELDNTNSTDYILQ